MRRKIKAGEKKNLVSNGDEGETKGRHMMGCTQKRCCHVVDAT